MGTYIVFSERRQEQQQSAAIARLGMTGPLGRAFGVLVEEEPEHVAHALNSGNFVPFKRAWAGKRYPIHVNPASVLYIQEEEVREPEE